MGQFLSTGIITNFSTSNKELIKNDISIQEFIDNLKIQTLIDPSIYDLVSEKDYHIFNLKQSIVEEQMIPFLEELYSFLGESDYSEVIEKLKSTSYKEWMKSAADKTFYQFQLDKYGMDESIYFDKPFKPEAKISFHAISLLMEGKILMESYGKQFKFYKYCIQKAFEKYSLARAIHIYITG